MRRLALVGVVALGIVAMIGMTLSSSADAKKKKKGPSVYQASQSPNAAIPNNPTTATPSTPFVSTFTVGKKFKGKTVGDVNVTGITTTGSASGAANDLRFRLTGPTGRAVTLIGRSGIGDQNIGPLTLDDDSPVSICDQDTPCNYYSQQLIQPFAGTANLGFLGNAGTGPLHAFNGTPMKGNWFLIVWDQSGNATTSVLNSWGLQITAERPVK